ncbi:HNH endonuclease [Vulgatibacter sp.]|uniref:HNH endonuclease n=1 Tax=Vulgatibacter sp. TaxID=1971226 RepID=UPI003565D7DC
MLDSSVLVLNRSFQPIHVCSLRRAFTLLYQGVAKAIDEEYRLFDFDSWAALSAEVHAESIGTVSRRIRVPRVVVLVAFDRLPRMRVRFSRHNIYQRDDSTCQYCARRLPRAELNLDHVVPRSQGGKTSWENVVCSCIPCNLKKANRTPEQAGMELLQVPVRPRWTPGFRPTGRGYKAWIPFLTLVDVSYWNTELLDE